MAMKLAENGKGHRIKPQPKPEESVQQRIVQLVRQMNDAMIERDAENALTMTAVVANSTLLLVGPPGCAKSHTLETLVGQISDASKFTWLIGKFTAPNEIFGSMDLPSFKKNNVFRINTTDKLPEAHYCFLSEFFKGSTAIGNSLLRIVNERRYNDGTGEKRVPLRCLVADSNEYPQDGELGAMFDRFVIRKPVHYIASPQGAKTVSSNLMRLIRGRKQLPKPTVTLSLAELDQAHREAMALPVTEEAWKTVGEIVQECINQGVRPSDRRCGLIEDMIQSWAYVQGATQVEPDHLEILSHVLWDSPEEQPAKVASIVAAKSGSITMRVSEMLGQIGDVVAKAPQANLNDQDRNALGSAMDKLTEYRNELRQKRDVPCVLLARDAVKDAIETIAFRLNNIRREE